MEGRRGREGRRRREGRRGKDREETKGGEKGKEGGETEPFPNKKAGYGPAYFSTFEVSGFNPTDSLAYVFYAPQHALPILSVCPSRYSIVSK